jgi:hypothetical protein
MSSKYPVEQSDDAGQIDALNYLLSGPGGLGQFFKGFSSYTDAYLTGNFRIPFTQDTAANLYVAPIALSNAEQLDQRTIKYTFAAPQATPPFSLGNGLSVDSVTPSDWDSSNLSTGVIGVVECTTTYVIVRNRDAIGPLPAYVSGGNISYTSSNYLLSTDCNARVIVTGGTDRVFIAAQLNNIISYTASTSSDVSYLVQINRYYGIPNNSPTNPDFIFVFDKTISQKTYSYTGLTGTGSLPEVETIFTTVIDNPGAKYWWYILEIEVDTTAGDLEITESKLGLRSLSAQVVKE